LCFHKIGDLADFERKIRFLCRHYNVVSLNDFTAGRLSLRELNVCITFDDGSISSLEATSILERYHVPATFFLCSGYLDCRTQEEWESFCRERLKLQIPESSMGWDGAQFLAHHPLFQVGGHTRHHKSLGRLEDPEEVLREILSDKQILEEQLGCTVEHFAYPFGYPGDFAGHARNAVTKAGYRLAVTLIPGPNTTTRDRLLLHRDCLDEVSSSFLIRAWMEGGYDFWKALQIRRQLNEL